MSQELPYFKFFPGLYLPGDITLETFEMQGVFINVCCVYWANKCSLAIAKLKPRYGGAIDILIEKGLIKQDGDLVRVSFLDKQWGEYTQSHTKNVQNGKKGAIKRWSENSPPVALREDKIREDKNNMSIFDQFRKKYPGTKRGSETEFKNFKKHKDWKQTLPTLETALSKQKSDREEKSKKSEFIPPWKNLQTWINNRCWEDETISTISPNGSLLTKNQINDGVPNPPPEGWVYDDGTQQFSDENNIAFSLSKKERWFWRQEQLKKLIPESN